MDLKLFFSALFAFIALVNPIQKLFVVFSLRDNYSREQLNKIVTRATITALAVLILFLFLGEVILSYLFNLQIYAFQITCGVVLFYNGFVGLQKGTVLSIDKGTKIEDIIAVPIAIPMIAGPATITAVVTMPSMYGKLTMVLAVVISLGLNLVLMRNSDAIGRFLVKYNILMPLIRITGLIVASIGIQMIFSGITVFIENFQN